MKDFSNVTGIIVGPIVLAILAGRWLDEKFDSGPWFIMSLVILAFVFSIFNLSRR